MTCSSDDVIASLTPAAEGEQGAKRHNMDQHDSIVNQYKELIREQVSCVEKELRRYHICKEYISTASWETTTKSSLPPKGTIHVK